MSRKKLVLIICILTLGICASIIASVCFYKQKNSSASNPEVKITITDVTQQTSESSTGASESAQTVYVLKSYGGRIAVFYEGEHEPIEIWDIRITDLPVHDREQLQDGVYIYGDEALTKMKEDLDG